ncbi:hypothetical protein Hamer_G020515 [Homarus americanus]|uniref:Uncharacterized protein n=1 Tax=Homarus americanus TaxID=6706 RepID=A0A8J5MYN8_HOMAM|nr:hypothetical protein Hamer_G020515 [Homarus americanus]
MPVSPYYGQGGYVNRNYTRANSGSSYVPMMDCIKYSSSDTRGTTGNTPDDSPSNYFRSKYIIPEDGPASSYLAPKYTPASRSGYNLSRFRSTDNVPDSSSLLEDSRIKKSPSSSSVFTGNTAALRKTFNGQDVVTSTAPYTNSIPKYSDYSLSSPKDNKLTGYRLPEERKFAGKYGRESSYASQYLARINMSRDVRPKEIDTRDINTTEKPVNAKWQKTDPAKDNEGLISRNRQVVRLTIKREKNEQQDPFVIKNRTLNTIAQRLIEKYQVAEKKPEPSGYQPMKRRFYQDPPKDETLETKLTGRPPLPSSSAVSKTTSSDVPKDTPISKASPKKSTEAPEEIKTVPCSPEGEGEVGAATILQRATATAETKKELQSWEEVKDAIYAAVLHPDVDIESDEEMEKLIKGDAASPESSIKGKGTSEEDNASSDVGKGQAIVGQLKRFVKLQESVKCPNKKRSSVKDSRRSKKSRKSKDKNNKDIVDKAAEKDKGEERENTSLLTGDLVSGEARTDINTDTKEKLLQPPTTMDNEIYNKENKEKNDIDKTQSTRKKEETEISVKEKKITKLDEKTNTRDRSSLLSANLVLRSVASEDRENTKIKTQIKTDKTESEKTKSEIEVNSPKTQGYDTLPLKLKKKKGNSSLLSPDLVLNKKIPDDKVRKIKSICTTDQTEPENKEPQVEKGGQKSINDGMEQESIRDNKKEKSNENEEQAIEDEKEQTIIKVISKFDKKGKNSLLSDELVLKSVTSEEIKTTKEQTEAIKVKTKTLEGEGGEKNEAKDKEEQLRETLSTKIPQIKKKVKKQTAIEEDSLQEVPQLRVFSQAGAPSRSTPERQSTAQEKVSKSQELPHDLDVSSEVNKNLNSKTSTTNSAQTYDHQPKMTGVEIIKSILDKEAKAREAEESSARDKNEGITGGKSSSDVSVELGTSTISEAPYFTWRHKGEKAVTEECRKDITDTVKSPQEIYSTVCRSEDNEKIQREKTNEQVREKPQELKQEERDKTKKIPFTVKLPEQTPTNKSEEEKEISKTTKPSGIPRWKIEATAQVETHKLIELKQRQNETKDKTTMDKGADNKNKQTEITEDGQEKQEVISVKAKQEQILKHNEVKKEAEDSQDALLVKKAIKRPRQIAPPPAPEKPIGNELLKARNILKRPVKQNAITSPADNNKQDQANTTGVQAKKIWKKEVAHLVPPNQGNQFLQARNVLKKVVKVEKVENKEETVPEVIKPKKVLKKPVQTKEPDAETETTQETRGRPLRKQRPNRSRSGSSSSSDDGSTVRKKAEKPKRLMKPKPQGAEKTPTPSPKTSAPGSPKTRGSVEASTGVTETQDGNNVQKPSSTKDTAGSTGQDPKLSACQSADSGYGSSPSTPQPTPTVPEVKDEETCSITVPTTSHPPPSPSVTVPTTSHSPHHQSPHTSHPPTSHHPPNQSHVPPTSHHPPSVTVSTTVPQSVTSPTTSHHPPSVTVPTTSHCPPTTSHCPPPPVSPPTTITSPTTVTVPTTQSLPYRQHRAKRVLKAQRTLATSSWPVSSWDIEYKRTHNLSMVV